MTQTPTPFKIIAISAVIMIFGFAGCSKKKSQPQAPPEVYYSLPFIHDVDNYLYYTGNTQAYQTVDIVARVSGYLQEVKFEAGARVRKGQVLFVIEPEIYKDQVNIAKASLDAANARLELAKATYNKKLIASKNNAVSEIEVLEAKAQLDEAQANVESADAQYTTAKQNLSYAYVTAPCDGLITRNLIDKGNFVGSSQGNSVLATLVDDDPMYVYFNIEDSWVMTNFEALKKMDEKQKKEILADDAGFVFFTPDNNNDYKYKAKLDYINPMVDLSSGTINVRAVMENRNSDIPSGLIIKVKMPTYKIRDAVLIPESAIGSDQAGSYVWVVGDSNIVRKVIITTGDQYNNSFRAVLKNLRKDDKVVTRGIQRCKDGIKVNPLKDSIPDPFATEKPSDAQ